MICSSCGAENAADLRFCLECGNRLATACPSCGTANPAGARFCGQCGTRLAVDEGPTSPRADGASGGTDGVTTGVPSATGASVATERRLVTVLFADLVGFTALAADRDPETVRDLLSRYFDVARDIVDRYGGTIEKFIGDAVMAVWGTPIAREDDAERAVRAGLDLVEAIGILGREAAIGVDLQLRAGILTGEAAVAIGATGQGMVAGDIVNTASRLQSVAAPGTVLVGESTQRAASGAIAFEPAGDQVLKGKSTPVPAWRALRVVAERGGQNRAEGLEAPFVGRDDELRLLKDRFHATARERRVRLVSVTGQAGIGKSRLAWEFLKYIDGLVETIWWHDGRSPAYGDGLTFWALGEMVRQRAGLVESDDEATTRAHVQATLAEFVPDEAERRRLEAALLALLGVEEAPPGGRDALFVAWRTFFERVATDHPAVLVFEDLQYADPGLLDFIDHLLDWSIGYPIFVLTLARPELIERRPGWGAGRRDFLAVSLEPLSEPAMRQLLAGFVPGLPEPAVARILERAGGIPLYAVETVRMLVAEGRLELDAGVYRPVGDLTALAVPESLHALIASRLDALDPVDRSLLQDGAVLGVTFQVEALAALSGLSPDELEPRLRGLSRREILVLDADPRSPERGQYGFTQALIREVAYASLAKKERRSRHLAAARHFESFEGSETAGALAAHYLDAWRAAPDGPEGEAVAVQARLALRGAAERAASLGSHEQELTFLERALSVATDPADEADLSERASAAAASSGRLDQAIGLAERAAALYRQLGDRAAVVRATSTRARAYTDGLRNDEAIEAIEPVRVEFADLAGTAAMVELEAQLARSLFLLGRDAEALEIVERVLPAAERLDLAAIVVDSMITKGTIFANTGRPLEGVALLEAARRQAEAEGLPDTTLRAHINLSAALAASDPRAALDVVRRGLEAANRFGIVPKRAVLLNNAVASATMTGDWDWALGLLDEIVPAGADVATATQAVVGGAQIAALRGEPPSPILAQIETMIVSFDDFNAQAIRLDLQYMIDLAAGDLERARDSAFAMADLESSLPPYAIPLAARAAAWLRDVGSVRRALVAHRRIAPARGLIAADRRWIEAGLAALEGRRAEALAGYHEALGQLHGLGLSFVVALVAIDMAVLLGPEESDVRAAAAEGRETLAGLRAQPLIDRLDRAMGPRGTSGPGTAPTISGHTGSPSGADSNVAPASSGAAASA